MYVSLFRAIICFKGTWCLRGISSHKLEDRHRRYTSEKDVRDAVKVIVNEVKRLRSLSPLWEMAQEGVDISKIKWASH